MEKFKELVSLCKASVEISVNDHKDFYQSVEQHINEQVNEEEREDIKKDVFDEMIKRDTIVRVTAYPHTPIGFFAVYHYDIDMAVEIVLDAVKSDR